MKGLLVSNDFGLSVCEKQCQKQQQMEINKNMIIGLEMQEEKEGHRRRWVVFGVSLCSQSGQCACQVMPAFGWAAGVCAWQSAAEWRRSEMQ